MQALASAVGRAMVDDKIGLTIGVKSISVISLKFG
jgi:hypothetical protein